MAIKTPRHLLVGVLSCRASVVCNISIALLDAICSLGISRILFLSSGGTVYGIPEVVPIPEEHPLRPINSYGIVKVAIESYLEMYRRTRGLSPIIIRASNPYGSRQGHKGVQGVVTTFLSRVLEGDTIEIWGDGSVVRDYLHVTDLADLCVRALCSDKTGPYNAGSGQGKSINEIIEVLRLATGKVISPVYKPGRALDVPRSVLDTSRAKAAFGWTANTELVVGIASTWEWMQRARNI
jgi:UDP-glucose 4-epimerase